MPVSWFRVVCTSALLAAPALAQGTVLFDFDSAPLYAPFPLDLTVGGVTAHFSATGQGYSIQSTSTAAVVPVGFTGRFLYPSSVFQADLLIGFSKTLTGFSILYAPQELGCDDSARMRVTAYRGTALVGTTTTTAPNPGTWPAATLACTFPQGFDRVVVHWDARPPTCQDYGPIFLADNMRITLATPAACVPYGTGCAGTAGTPQLAAAQGTLPWLGTTFVAELSGLGPNPTQDLPFLVLGNSKSAWGSYALPLDLTFLGMANCLLLASPQLEFGLVNTGGAALWSVAIPSTPSLVGGSLFVQGGVTSAGANVLGVVTSNGCELRLGLQ